MKPLIVANWKMNTTLSEAMILAHGVKEGLTDIHHVDVVLCPPFPWLVPIAELLRTHPLRHLHLGAQNIFWKENGAYTGEVSPAMLKGLVSHVIIGHSERRKHFHESDSEIGAKLKLALAHGIRPILCVGELKRPSNELLSNPSEVTALHVKQPLEELREAIEDLSREQASQLIVAYEPVWAISSNASATAASGMYADVVASHIQKVLTHKIGSDDVPVLYGGSVNADNVDEFTTKPHISGVLVGGASLKVGSFLSICQKAGN